MLKLKSIAFWKNFLVTSAAVLMIYWFVNDYFKWKDLEKNGVVVKVRLWKSASTAKGTSVSLYCSFILAGVEHRTWCGSNLRYEYQATRYLGREFYGLYSSKYDFLRLLGSREEFEDHHLEFTDSSLVVPQD